MKKYLKSFTMVILCVFLVSCQYTSLDDLDNPKAADEILKVSTYVQREDLPEGYYVYDGEDRQDYGRYETSDGKTIAAGDVFEKVELEVGKTRICAPMGLGYDHNLNITLDFDGYVEIETDPAQDERIRLAHSVNAPESTNLFTMTIENPIRARSPMNLNVCPLGRYMMEGSIVETYTLVDCEYFINVRAYDINERPKASARIRLKSINDPDPEFSANRLQQPIYGAGEETTRFLEIELVSVEYGEEIG